MNKIIIGKSEGRDISINIPTLMRTRLLIQANSGGGKSYLLRKLLEITYGKVQHIVLDLEGEFATLREKYDYLLVGKEGDIQTDIRSAELLAKKILEEKVNVIIDLYELKHYERILFVKRFLDAMINSHKKLWHPCLVVVDEAHIFCPEKSPSESTSAVIDLATRGRKRGFCAVLATQRLSKLHKDAAAECNNKLIGRTGLDVDMKRASEELGFTSKPQMLSLRDLEAGEFFAFGSAISKKVIKVKIGRVKTSHVEVGGGKIIVPAPATKKIKKILAKLIDLPKKAEEELHEKEDLKKKIRELQLEKQKRIIPMPTLINPKQLADAEAKGIFETEQRYKPYCEKLEYELHRRNQIMKDVSTKLNLTLTMPFLELKKPNLKKSIKPMVESKNPPLKSFEEGMKKFVVKENDRIELGYESGALRAGAMKMLKAIAMFHPKSITKNQVAALSGFSAKGGTFGAYFSDLKRAGWISINGNFIEITNEGLKNAGNFEALPSSPKALKEMWASKFRRGAAQMFEVLFEIYPNEISKEELGERTNFISSGGTFGAYLSDLKRSGLIEIKGQMVKASKYLFMEDD